MTSILTSTTITTTTSMSTTITTTTSMSTTIETQPCVSRGYGTIIVAVVIILALISTFLVLKGRREEVIYREIVNLSIKDAKSRIMKIENPDYDKIIELERAGKNRKSFISWLERRKLKVVR